MSRRRREKRQLERKQVWQVLGRALRFALPHWRILAVALLMTAIYAGANSMRVVVVGLVMDGVLLPRDEDGRRGRTLEAYDLYMAPYLPDSLQLRRGPEPQKLRVDGFTISKPERLEIDHAEGHLRVTSAELKASSPDPQGSRQMQVLADQLDFAPDDKAWLGRSVPALVGGPARIELTHPDLTTETIEASSFVVLEFYRHRRVPDEQALVFTRGRLAYATDGMAQANEARSFQRARLVFDSPELPHVGPIHGTPGKLVRTFGLEEASGSVLPLLLALAVMASVLALVIGSSSFFKFYLAQLVVFRTMASLRQALFEHLSRLGMDYYSQRRSGDLISRLTNDVGTVQLSMRFFFSNALQQPFTLFFSMAIALYTSWQLTIPALLGMATLFVPVVRSGRKVNRHGRGSLSKLGELTETMGQLLSGIRVVKAFGLEHEQSREFERRNAGFVKTSMKMVHAKAMSRSIVECLYNLLAAVLLVIGGWMLASSWFGLTIGDFAVFLGALLNMYTPLRGMVKAYNTVQESLAGAGRIFEVLDETPTVRDAPGVVALPPLRDSVRFEGVWFRYEYEQPWVLRDVSFEAPAGQTVALVGPTGAGKSTVLDLLARFHDPQQGHIRVDGQDLREVSIESLYSQIAIVGQDPFLFNTSILENIRHGRPGATMAEVEEAARAAQVHEEILATSHGYETVIGERGMKLSGGQRQRLTIARAILKNAPILILDEATSALDTASERMVQAALDRLMEGRTTFVIAHRLSTIVHADQILVLDAGRIIERGTHASLLEQGGLYARLQQLQDGTPGNGDAVGAQASS